MLAYWYDPEGISSDVYEVTEIGTSGDVAWELDGRIGAYYHELTFIKKVEEDELTPDCNYFLADGTEHAEVTLIEVFDGLAVVEADSISYQFEVPTDKLYRKV